MSETVVVTRPTFNYNKFDELYEPKKADKSIRTKIRKWKSNAYCSKQRMWKFLVGKLPVISWLPKYKKDYIFGDAIASATVGIIRVPQGMAYALLAGVPPVYGLYSCFFPVLLWFLFSTSKHTSVGTNAVICLMLQRLASKNFVQQPVTFDYNSTVPLVSVGGHTFSNSELAEYQTKITNIATDPEETVIFNPENEVALQGFVDETQKLQIVLSASLITGLIQLIMAFCRLGFLTTLMPDPVIQGFTTGAAFHVAISQAKYCFGLAGKFERSTGMFELFKTCGQIAKHLGQTNITDLIISLVCIPTMLGFKQINQKYKKQLRNIPIPIELILIIILTLASYFGHFEKEPFHVKTVNYIPTGFQDAHVPSYLHLVSEMLTDCVIMALISVAVSLSLTKIYADKNEYDTDANQEILALGICNTLSTFVGSFAVAASLSRTAIQDSAGGKTQLVSVLSSTLMLVVLLWLAPFFQPVPKSVLACIIIVALKNFFLQFGNLPKLYKVCKADFVIWVVTCLAVVLFGVDYGLFIGIFFSISVLMYRLQHPKHGLLGRITNTDLYAHMNKYPDAIEIAEIKIFQFADSVSYTNKDAFRKKLYSAIGFRLGVTTATEEEVDEFNDVNDEQIEGKFFFHKKRTQPASENPVGRFNPSKVLEKPEKYVNKTEATGTSLEMTSLVGSMEDTSIRNRKSALVAKNSIGISYLILDGTMWSFVDSTAGREMVQIAQKFKKLNITVMLAGVSPTVLKILERMDMFTNNVKREHVFVTLHDAVVTAERLVNGNFKNGNSDQMELRPGYPGFDSLLL